MRIENPISNINQIYTRDHDLLTGLSDDDHTQYLNNARHDIKTRHPLTVIGNSGGAAGDIIKWDGSDFVRLAKGTAGQYLRVNSAGSDLEYGSISAKLSDAVYNTTDVRVLFKVYVDELSQDLQGGSISTYDNRKIATTSSTTGNNKTFEYLDSSFLSMSTGFFDRYYRFTFGINIQALTYNRGAICFGERGMGSAKGYYIYWDDNNIYVMTYVTSQSIETAASTSSYTGWHIMSVEFNPTSSVKLYIDGALIHTKTTEIPSGDMPSTNCIFGLGVKTDDTGHQETVNYYAPVIIETEFV